MLPDRVSSPEPLPYDSGALMTALRGPARKKIKFMFIFTFVSIKALTETLIEALKLLW